MVEVVYETFKSRPNWTGNLTRSGRNLIGRENPFKMEIYIPKHRHSLAVWIPVFGWKPETGFPNKLHNSMGWYSLSREINYRMDEYAMSKFFIGYLFIWTYYADLSLWHWFNYSVHFCLSPRIIFESSKVVLNLTSDGKTWKYFNPGIGSGFDIFTQEINYHFVGTWKFAKLLENLGR
jgi:hypothetical protein